MKARCAGSLPLNLVRVNMDGAGMTMAHITAWIMIGSCSSKPGAAWRLYSYHSHWREILWNAEEPFWIFLRESQACLLAPAPHFLHGPPSSGDFQSMANTKSQHEIFNTQQHDESTAVCSCSYSRWTTEWPGESYIPQSLSRKYSADTPAGKGKV